MSIIPLEGFTSNPPLSKVTPFPIRVILGKVFFLLLLHLISRSSGLFSDDLPTKFIKGNFFSSFLSLYVSIFVEKSFKQFLTIFS